jgi:hypothetical protein
MTVTHRRLALATVVSVALVPATLLPGNWQAAVAPAPNPLKPYVAAGKLYALFKPADWSVIEEPQPNSFRVLVQAPDGSSRVDFYWARHDEGAPNALAFLLAYKKSLSLKHRDVVLSEVFVSPDSSRATAKVRYRSASNVVSGKYYFESRRGGHSAQGYCAPESRLAAQRSLLLNVMASFAFARVSAASDSRRAAPAPAFVQIPLAPRAAQDGSLSIRVPADWNFLAGGGKVLTASRDGGMGFIFTSFSGNPMLPQASVAQGIIGTRYLPPAQALGFVFSAFRNQRFRIQSAQPDAATMRECVAQSGRTCDAQDFVVSYVSPEGTPCVGAFKMVNAPPSPVTGMWFCIVAGIWGPEREFYRYFPLLEQIGSSFAINDQYARRYIQAGLENLRRLQQKTQAAMQDLNQTRAQNQQDWEARQERKEYMDSKWDDYRRGNSYWVSELEGGKVYQTDSGGTQDNVTGQYYEGKPYNWVNFEGQNPRHPSETMREVTSYELKKMGG